VDQLGPQVLDQLAHGIGDDLDALKLKDFLVYTLDLVDRFVTEILHSTTFLEACVLLLHNCPPRT
jgi:hypothetical protein